MELIHVDDVPETGDMLLTIRVPERPSVMDRIRLAKPRVIEIRVHGSSTVWFHYPSGKRCGTRFEGQIVELLKRREFAG